MSFIVGDQDLVRFTLYQKLFLQDVINVFWYRFDGATTSSTASDSNLWQALESGVVDLLRLRTSAKLTYDRAEITHVESPDFNTGVFPIAQPGLIAGECLPAFVSIGIQLRMTSRAVRTGYKRFAGIEETQVVDGELSSTPLGLWQAIADSWVAGITVENDLGDDVGLLKPIVVSSKDWIDGVPTVYRLVDTAVVKRQLGSQNTRKIGRGS